MSTLENLIIRGNLAVEASQNTGDQGFGDVFVNRNVSINGSTASTSPTSGALVITGGLGLGGNLYGDSNLDINGITTLDETTIDTTDGQFSVSGTNKISFTPSAAVEITADANSFFTTTTGTLTLESQVSTLSVLGETGISLTSATGAVDLSAAATSSYTTSVGNLTISSDTGTAYLSGQLNVNIDSSAGGVSIDANSSSNFTVSGAFPLEMASTAGSVILTSGKASTDSIRINTTNAAGGIDIDAGTNGISADTTGAISLDANNATSNFTVTTNDDAQDLIISVINATDSSVIITSEGTNFDAIKINATDVDGGIDIDAGTNGIAADTTGGISLDAAGVSNFTVTGAFDLTTRSTAGSVIIQAGEAVADAIKIYADSASGGIDIDAGTNGITADTSGGISLDAAGASNFTVTGASDLTVQSTAGSINIQGGEAAADAIRIYASDTAGGIDIDAGTSGMTIDTTGGISLDAADASNFTIATTSNSQNLTLGITGATDSSVILTSSGTGASALDLTASAGGITVSAASEISIETTDIINGITIGTVNSNVPITIGNYVSSTVTVGKDLVVAGNLTVSGTTTTVNTETVTVEDNIVVYNSGPVGTADGGLAIKRFQRSASGTSDDIVSDTPNQTSVQHGGNTQTGTTASTIILNTGASAITGYYNGWWIKITSGARTGDVRRIKTYDGSTKVATIYATGDTDASYPGQEIDFNSPYTDYDGVSYNLYGNVFIASVYDESADRWILASVATEPAVTAQITPIKYIDFQAANIYSTGTVYTNTITGYSGTAVNVSGVTIDTGALTGVTSINGLAPDANTTVVLPDNTTSKVDITPTSTTGVYMILVKANYVGGPMAIFTAAKSNSGNNNAPTRLISSQGSNNERIDAAWDATQKVQLKFQNAPGTAGTYSFSVKVITA